MSPQGPGWLMFQTQNQLREGSIAREEFEYRRQCENGGDRTSRLSCTSFLPVFALKPSQAAQCLEVASAVERISVVGQFEGATGKKDVQDDLLIRPPRFRVRRYSNSSRAQLSLLPLGLEVEHQPTWSRGAQSTTSKRGHLPRPDTLDTNSSRGAAALSAGQS